MPFVSTEYEAPRWRFRDLLRMLGTTAAIRKDLKRLGHTPPPPNTIDGWRQRDSIPSAWVPVFVGLALEHGIVRDIKDLQLERTKSWKPGKGYKSPPTPARG